MFYGRIFAVLSSSPAIRRSIPKLSTPSPVRFLTSYSSSHLIDRGGSLLRNYGVIEGYRLQPISACVPGATRWAHKKKKEKEKKTEEQEKKLKEKSHLNWMKKREEKVKKREERERKKVEVLERKKREERTENETIERVLQRNKLEEPERRKREQLMLLDKGVEKLEALEKEMEELERILGEKKLQPEEVEELERTMRIKRERRARTIRQLVYGYETVFDVVR